MKTAENVQRSTRLRKATARQASNVQRSKAEKIHRTFEKFVVPSYTRFDLVLERGEGSYVWDVDGKRYLDLAGGIAVCSLGHAHPEITEALTEQAQKLIHVSNLRMGVARSEEHTSELQSRRDLVCRLLLEKKKDIKVRMIA